MNFRITYKDLFNSVLHSENNISSNLKNFKTDDSSESIASTYYVSGNFRKMWGK